MTGTAFVLDNSVAMRWLLQSAKKADQNYAIKVLESLSEAEAVVPQLWPLEAANVLLGAEQQREITAGEAEQFIAQLENLPLRIDSQTVEQAFTRTFALARAYRISSYDAAYLEIAIRMGLPLATLDKALIRAARKAAIERYLP